MPNQFWILTLLVLLFLGVNSCKKEKVNTPQPPQVVLNDSCNTPQDCKAIGKYAVTAYYWFSDPPAGDYEQFVSGHTTITITEISPGKIAFSGDSIFHIKLNASYDSLQQFNYTNLGPLGTYAIFAWTGTSDTTVQWAGTSDTTAQIIFYGSDTINASYTYSVPQDVGHAGYQWFGVKVH